MDLEQLQRDLQAFAQARDNRVEIWVQIYDVSDHFGGTPAERIYRGSFQRQPGSPKAMATSEPQQENSNVTTHDRRT